MTHTQVFTGPAASLDEFREDFEGKLRDARSARAVDWELERTSDQCLRITIRGQGFTASTIRSVLAGCLLRSRLVRRQPAAKAMAAGDAADCELAGFFKVMGLLLFMLSHEERETWYHVQQDLTLDLAEMFEGGYSARSRKFIIGWHAGTELGGMLGRRLLRLVPGVSIFAKILKGFGF